MRIFYVAVLVAACWPMLGLASETLAGPYTAQILRVIDGNTVEARVRIWLGTELTTLVRVRGVYPPALHSRCPGEPEAAEAAKAYLATLLPPEPVRLTTITHDKYHTSIAADILTPSGQDVAAALIAAGYTRPAPVISCRSLR